MFYWKDYKHREVDFIIKEGDKVSQIIQVTWKLTPDNEGREIKALLGASKELGCKNLMITWDQDEIIKKDGMEMKVVELWRWLTAVTENGSSG